MNTKRPYASGRFRPMTIGDIMRGARINGLPALPIIEGAARAREAAARNAARQPAAAVADRLLKAVGM